MRTFLASTLLSTVFLAAGIVPAMAQVGQLNPGTDCANLGINCDRVAANQGAITLGNQVWRIVNIGLSLVSLLAVIMLVYAGVRYILARGDEKEAETAKNIIIYTVIGLVVIGLSGALVRFLLRGN